MKVLLVEENSAVRRVIRQLVTSPGIWIQECVNSANAMAAYAAGRADFVVMDVGMKDPDGIAATKQIKAMDPAAKIVLVSDYDDAALRESARLAGACGYVLKDNLLELPHLLREFSAMTSDQKE
jgi:two-component system chemotaxis response regulator CheY